MEKKTIFRLACAAIIIHAVMGKTLLLNGKLPESTETAYNLITIDWYKLWSTEADKAKLFGKSKLIHADKVIVIKGFSTKKPGGKIWTPTVEIQDLASDLKSITELITGFNELILSGECASERLKLLAELKWVGVVNMERLILLTKEMAGKLENVFLSDGAPKQFIVSKSGFELIIQTEILKKMLQKKSHRLVVTDGKEDRQEVLSCIVGNQNTIDVIYADNALALKFLPVILSAGRILAAKFKHIGGKIPKGFEEDVSNALFKLHQATLNCRIVTVNKKLCIYRF